MKKALLIAVALICSTGSTYIDRSGERYAIQNVLTGKNIRPFQAKKTDGNPIISYNDWRWQCMTWELLPVGEGRYRLRNRYTGKTLAPSSASGRGVSLWQQPLTDSGSPEWQFIKRNDGTYLIRQANEELYLTASSEKTNSPIVLMPLEDSDAQKWRLRKQDPWF